MQVGGPSTLWMFADMLEPGKKYPGRITGCGEHRSKSGKAVPYVVFVGALADGNPAEYQISVWRIKSKKAFDPEKEQEVELAAQGQNIFVHLLGAS